MLYMDTRLEVYPGYQRHRAAMHTVAHFLNMEIWRVAEALSCRIRSNHQPRMYLIVPGNLTNKNQHTIQHSKQYLSLLSQPHSASRAISHPAHTPIKKQRIP